MFYICNFRVPSIPMNYSDKFIKDLCPMWSADRTYNKKDKLIDDTVNGAQNINITLSV